jgi:SAM-dependent methyltransferase
LVARCKHVVAVDPSANVHENDLVNRRIQCPIEQFESSGRFDLATMRMVVEHVERPHEFVTALSRLLRPGGVAIVFTVNRYSPLSLLSRIVPYALHHPIKKAFWGGEKEDTFPVRYRMNTRRTLLSLFDAADFDEVAFLKVDDLSTFGRFKRMNYLELLGWYGLRRLRIQYPENCLLGIYRRRLAEHDSQSSLPSSACLRA